MGGELVLSVGSEAIKTVLMVSLPLLGLGLVTGLLVSIFQAVTQIQEMTLTFVPKILAITLGLFFFGPYMLDRLLRFTQGVIQSIPQVMN
jgi:flagellar biosynthetic protein FliQ